MAERIVPEPYWHYDENEEAVIVTQPTRAPNMGPTPFWEYDYTPKVGEKVIVVSNKDSDWELTVDMLDSDHGPFYIWHGCVQPVTIPIPEDVDLTKPEDIEKWLEDA